MSARRLAPPSGGVPAPMSVSVNGDAALDLLQLAREICRRYRLEYPDEEQRYGSAGIAWCIHDNQHLLNWAAGSVNGHYSFNQQVAWLAKVLEARLFPLDRLARNLDIGAEVVTGHVDGRSGERIAAVLTEAAAYVRSHGTFLD